MRNFKKFVQNPSKLDAIVYKIQTLQTIGSNFAGFENFLFSVSAPLLEIEQGRKWDLAI